jgi:hypothetical protein
MADIAKPSLPAGQGTVVAIVNVLVIAIALGVAERDAGLPILVAVVGCAPALALGALLGWLAGLTATKSPRWRAVMLALPAFGLVAVLGTTVGLTAAVPLACIPTLAAALVLERWTRHVVPAAVPVATARSLRT